MSEEEDFNRAGFLIFLGSISWLLFGCCWLLLRSTSQEIRLLPLLRLFQLRRCVGLSWWMT